MDKINDVTQYVFKEYKRVTGKQIDEIRVYRILCFAQRELLAFTDIPLFEGDFKGWKYEPVCKDIRNSIIQDGIIDATNEISDEAKYVINNIIQQYGTLASSKSSELSHKEQSWKNARVGLSEGDNGNVKLSWDDIRKDTWKVCLYDSMWDMYYDEFEDEVMI